MADNDRKSGIEIIGDVPWGTHFCQFYQNREDLVDILVPYFKAGLENNELCMWITSEPLNVAGAKAALRKEIKNLDDYIKKGQIEILPHDDWYLKDGVFDLRRVLEAWVDRLNRALSEGYEGMRASGNTAWLERNNWKGFTEYEEEINKNIGNYRMMALCTYSLDRCGAAEVIDVVSNHRFALIRRDGKWVVIEGAEQARVEKALRESEHMFRLLSQSSRDIICLHDLDHRYKYISPACKEILGYYPEELVGTDPWELVHPQDLVTSQEAVREKAEKGESFLLSYRIRRKSGEYIWFESVSRLLKDDKGRPAGFVTSSRDITERKQAELEYQTIVQTTIDGFWITDMQGRFLDVNDAYCRLIGYRRDELLKMSIPDIEAIENPQNITARIARIKKNGSDRFETQHKHKDGAFVDVEVSVNYLDADVGRMFVFVRDITERKKMEDVIRESEERFSKIFRSSPIPMALGLLPEGRWVDVNDSYLRLFGYTRDEVIGHTSAELNIIAPDEQARIASTFFENGGVANLELTPWTKTGRLLTVLASDTEITMRGKEYFLTTIVDITERRQAEQALLESESRYRSLVDLEAEVGEAIVMLQDEASKDGIQVFCNETWPRITGYSEDELLDMSFFDLVHPRDRKGSLTRHRKKMRGKSMPGLFEVTIVRKDRTEVPVEITSARTTYQGKLANVAYIRDISERKKQEKEHEFTRRLLEIANLGRQMEPTLKQFVQVIREFTGCEAAGIRVLDSEGNIHYQAYEGFSREFCDMESPLSMKSDRGMCVNVIKGETNPNLPFHSEDGSFYTNSTTDLLATVSDAAKGLMRNVCHEHGYESVAVVPVRLGKDILGLIHVVDKRVNMVPLDLVNALEDAAPQIGLSMRRLWAEHELSEEKGRLEVTLRSTGDGIIATDMTGRVVLLNRAAEQLTGWAQKEAIGKPIREIFYIIDERNRQPIPDPIENVLKTGRVIGLVNHAMLISRDGTERVIADSGAPIHDDHGRTFGAVLVFRDITESKRLEEEQVKVAKLESIGVLAGGIAHDFNNLLTAIIGNISLARRHVEPQGKAAERLNEAEKASERARDLTQQLLTFAKGGAPVKKAASISELVKETAAFALSGSDVRLELSLPEDLWMVEIDEGQMSQVIQNIVINADEAMPSGGMLNISAVNIAVQRLGALPLPKGNYVRIDIKDEGIGMSKQQLARIFEPYYSTKQKGSGLGLATVYSIIANHGGYITVESTQNVGSTFHVYLPASSQPAPVKKKTAQEKPIFGKGGRVLVMDDEEIIREMLVKMLALSGYEVEVTKNGTEAIGVYKQARESGRPFDAVILDLTVPGGMGGKETIEKMLEINPKIKAIVSSGYANDLIMSEYKKYGFSAVVTKPYNLSQIEETLRDVLGR